MTGLTDILFDLGGVILMHPFHVTPSVIAEVFGIPEELAGNIYRTRKGPWRTGNVRTTDMISDICRECGNREQVDVLLSRYREAYARYAVVNGEMIEIVETLRRRYRVSAWTNTLDIHYEVNRNRGLFGHFDKVFASCEMGVAKPDPASCAAVVRKLEVDPAACLMIDDRQENVDAVIAFGMKGYRFTDRQTCEVFLRKENLL